LQQPPDHHLAQLNIGRIRYEIDDPRMADFTNNLALVNGLAERNTRFRLALYRRERKLHQYAALCRSTDRHQSIRLGERVGA
jgi:hypothetical protein